MRKLRMLSGLALFGLVLCTGGSARASISGTPLRGACSGCDHTPRLHGVPRVLARRAGMGPQGAHGGLTGKVEILQTGIRRFCHRLFILM
jgi:hypothetical protein